LTLITTETVPVSTSEALITTQSVPVSTPQALITTESVPVGTSKALITTETVPVGTPEVLITTVSVPDWFPRSVHRNPVGRSAHYFLHFDKIVTPMWRKTGWPMSLSTVWRSLSEFVRNDFLLKSYWTEPDPSLAIDFFNFPKKTGGW
jgi:hypothetical protein